MSLLGLLPWRCGTCQERFFAGAVALRYLYLVHCKNCGNLETERVGRDRVLGGAWVTLQRILHFPAYRCDACRNRFFSLRKFSPVASSSFEEFNQPVQTRASDQKPAPEPAASAADAPEAAQLDDSGEHGL